MFQVTYPLITRDAIRVFDTEKEAQEFAAARRELVSRFLSIHDWRRVKVERIAP